MGLPQEITDEDKQLILKACVAAPGRCLWLKCGLDKSELAPTAANNTMEIVLLH